FNGIHTPYDYDEYFFKFHSSDRRGCSESRERMRLWSCAEGTTKPRLFMHVTVSKKDLSRVLARCQGVADKKSTMPVLGNVLLEARKSGELALAATDLYLAVSGSTPGQVDRPGSVAIGARDFFERVKMMPEGNITL